MATCTLRIGDRVALSSVGGAPEVEYALFDPGEIELAATGPGMVQEVGYQTTAEDAIARLKDAGISWALVLDTSAAMQPTLAMAYARGPAVRRIATALGPAELFDGLRYDPPAKVYEGRWLDLAALGLDLDQPRLTQTLQAMHLLALLREVTDRDPVRLTTRELMASARPGSRSFRRGTVQPADALPDSLRALSAQVRESRSMNRTERAVGPTDADLLEIIRDRIVLSPDPESQDRLRAIEKAIGIRQRPMRGPLADAELWALEEQLSAGRPEGISELVDALEKASGKQPATAYLRLRAALLGGREDPRAIAERISSLALSMQSFVELELLAFEAWNAAGDPKRALPFARDLIANSSVNDELRVRESMHAAGMRPSQAALEAVRSEPASPEPAKSEPPKPPARPRTLGLESEPPPRSQAPHRVTAAIEWASDDEERPTVVPGSLPFSARPTPDERDAQRRMTQPQASGQGSIESVRPSKPRPSAPPTSQPPLVGPVSSRKETPPMMFAVSEPTTGPQSAPRPPAEPLRGTPPLGIVADEARPRTAPPPGAPSQPRMAAVRAPSQPRMLAIRTPVHVQAPVSVRPNSRPSGDGPRLANRAASELMRGASQPPFRSDSPDAHLHVPRAAPVPRFDDAAEAAAALSLPEGLTGVPDPIETLPRTVLDARVQFTFLARELGREYDEQMGITLRADISGIEAMQRVLLERYKTRAVGTPEAAGDVRRHGAFLSEILARTFDAFWVDIGPSDVGYWAMVVPPGTRVWPFGRILRLIAMQHNERDLVSYFLELQVRAASGR